jgi:hypothetical protein
MRTANRGLPPRAITFLQRMRTLISMSATRARGHDHVQRGADAPVRPRRHVPVEHDVRFEDRRPVMDGLHCRPRLRRVLDGRPRLRPLDATTGNGSASRREPPGRGDGRWRDGFGGSGRSRPSATRRGAAEPDGLVVGNGDCRRVRGAEVRPGRTAGHVFAALAPR